MTNRLERVRHRIGRLALSLGMAGMMSVGSLVLVAPTASAATGLTDFNNCYPWNNTYGGVGVSVVYNTSTSGASAAVTSVKLTKNTAEGWRVVKIQYQSAGGGAVYWNDFTAETQGYPVPSTHYYTPNTGLWAPKSVAPIVVVHFQHYYFGQWSTSQACNVPLTW
jgi:hypothetical protein